MRRLLTILIPLFLFGLNLHAAEAAPPEAAQEQGEAENDPLIKLSEAVITIPLQKGVSVDDAIESMKLKANALNVKFVGHLPLWEEYKALGLKNIRRTEIFQFCDASLAKKMLDYDINFLAYMPCRIGVVEDAKGKFWLVTMNLNIFTSSDTLPDELQDLANKIRDDIETIMEAGASGAL